MTTAKRPKLTPASRQLDPEVLPSSSRCTWTAAEKLAFLQEYESYPHGAPERGALLRRNGIYTSHISKWRSQRNRGALAALTAQRRGPKPESIKALADEPARLQQENAHLQVRLATAEAVIDIQKSCASAWGSTPDAAGRAVMCAGIADLAPLVGVSGACRFLGVPRATYYRLQEPTEPATSQPSAPNETQPNTSAPALAAYAAEETRPSSPRSTQARALSPGERAQVREVLDSERFADCAPRTVYATLLDEQQYLCSWRTIYRILKEADEVRERRNQVRRTG